MLCNGSCICLIEYEGALKLFLLMTVNVWVREEVSAIIIIIYSFSYDELTFLLSFSLTVVWDTILNMPYNIQQYDHN